MTGGIDPDSVHSGYTLPTAAGRQPGANVAAQVHLHALAEASFGIGVICWVLFSSMISNRLFTRPALPSALIPTMAIELGVAAVAGPAYFAVAGRTASFMACVLGGYVVLMAVAQVRLIPVYRRISFTPGFWSFAFAYAAVATDALVWLAIKKPPGTTGYAIAIIALLSAFVSWIAFRTAVLAVRGQLFPPGPARNCSGRRGSGAGWPGAAVSLRRRRRGMPGFRHRRSGRGRLGRAVRRRRRA
jgi:tellurite resistance protein